MKSKEKILEQNPILETDEEGFVDFGEVSRRFLGKQCQYGSMYIKGIGGRPNLGEGLKIK